MTLPFYEIRVICCHGSQDPRAKRRLISRLSWSDNEPEFVEDLQAQVREGADFTQAELDQMLLNDRLAVFVDRKNRKGARVPLQDPRVDYELNEAVTSRADAWGSLRFNCSCGADVPLRQRTVDEWIRARVEQDPTRHVHELVMHPLALH